MWPVIFPIVIAGLGEFTKMGSALLIMAIVGGVILFSAYGYIAEIKGNAQIAYLIDDVSAHLFILYFLAFWEKMKL